MLCRFCVRNACSFTSRQGTAYSRSISNTSAGASTRTAAPNLSTPLGPRGNEAKPTPKSLSSCSAGTVMTGLNYIKGKEDPVALPDEEYPTWLWSCLENSRTGSGDALAASETGDEYSTSKKARKSALKRQRREQRRILATGDLSALAPKIPVTHQTINLPANEEHTADGAVAAQQNRDDLRRAMRQERKAKIKELNYLKSMSM